MIVRKENQMREDASRDVNLSFAFVAALESAYGGMWAFERALTSLDAEVDREEELARSEQVLERLQQWRDRLAAGEPMLRTEQRPVVEGDASRAWRLLDVAEGRLRSLISELIDSSDLETLAHDDFARHVRVAAMVECARAEQLHVRVMADWALATGDEEMATAWKQRLLGCAVRIEKADRWLAVFRNLRETPDEALLLDFLDDTLLLAATVATRVVDISKTFSLYTGVFDYAEVGIPTEQSEAWHERGFTPYEAGRWFAAGHSPERARSWLEVGAADPMVAAGFMWRGFTPAEAGPWLRRHISGRMAAAWARSGHDAEGAREWIALGIPEPHVLAQLPALESRVM
jgi:hypothetical protein